MSSVQSLIEREAEPMAQQSNSIPTPRAVLEELFLLLEDYGPAWYTEQHHNKALAALLERQM